MDGTEVQRVRGGSKGSRLPQLAGIQKGGLTECSESQQNARVQSLMPDISRFKGSSKREISPPAPQPEAKRKPLHERALEYPKPTANPPRPTGLKPRSMSTTSGLKPPSRVQASTDSASTTSFAKSCGPGRIDRNPPSKAVGAANGRKGPVSRPRTVHGHRSDHQVVPPMTPSVERVKHQLHVVESSISAIKNRRFPSKTLTPRKFLTKDSDLTGFTAWDVDGRVDTIESQFQELKDMVTDTIERRKGDENAFELAKTRVSELEDQRRKLEERQEKLKDELDLARDDGRQLRHELDKQKWDHERMMNDAERQHREALAELEREHRETVADLQRRQQSTVDELRREWSEAAAESQRQIDSLTRRHRQELEDERRKREGDVLDVQTRMGNDRLTLELEVQELRRQAEGAKAELEQEKSLRGGLQNSITELSACNLTLEARISSLKSQVEFLESDSKAQSDSFASMEARLQEALRVAEESRQRLIKEETERRILFNKYQELKGNIRVMCRVRPTLEGNDGGSGEGPQAGMSFPDDKTSAEIVVAGPEERSSLGVVTRKSHPFEFDRVFTPGTSNSDIFDEISQLVQSALDGYNVCIFCYGQTGSGKTYTMSAEDGMIPRATHMIYDTMTRLRAKSWEYSMEGSFVEVYNEELHDLLSPGQQRRLEIHHDEARRQTHISNCKTVRLDSVASVETMLAEAQRNRSVAATRANERSSRSHSVFILRLVGDNVATGERCEGTLNLVDLAGSERLKHSLAEGERMRETQSINKSLSCLGDVIEALGRGSSHVPYRNSKLTHLLQFSLGGNSKTLMFVMVSPLEVHLKETLTSLRFATKVHNTHIGTAKATRRVKMVEPACFAAPPSTTTLPIPTPKPNTVSTSTQQDAATTRAQSLQRFEQSCARLRWKFVDLENAYRRANAPLEWDFSVEEAERNFKVDFYEFYAWIEQAVVLILSVFGTGVSPSCVTAGLVRGRHAYHHNVLKALDEPTHPLHAILGTGDVRHALWKAKELRNKWKDAAEGTDETPPLRMYDLNWIVTQTMRGLEAAYEVALKSLREELGGNEGEFEAWSRGVRVEEWEWMVEPMDWQA
ncbi:hypothetical protein CP533_0110 [Ophiocordyceps camponoti-saundersi (nom. inval.)]|nr:hypothetical protein CP533_0110 [Ophiocordyceps camponoti-saundersi (nom. inval.)]